MYSNIFGKYCVLRLRDKDGSLQADGRRSRNSFCSEKGKRTVQTGKVVGAGRGKRERTPAPYRKGALRNGAVGHPSETIPFLSGVRDPYT